MCRQLLVLLFLFVLVAAKAKRSFSLNLKRTPKQFASKHGKFSQNFTVMNKIGGQRIYADVRVFV